MRARFMLGPAAVVLLVACNAGGQAAVGTGGMASVAPDTTACADAPQLRQRAAEERRRATETSSDQTRIVLASRANFLASLAVVAELHCATTDNEATEALQAALQIARAADGTAGFYAQATQWAEANFAATRAIEILVQRRAPTAEE
jgi:hypothetical protein